MGLHKLLAFASEGVAFDPVPLGLLSGDGVEPVELAGTQFAERGDDPVDDRVVSVRVEGGVGQFVPERAGLPPRWGARGNRLMTVVPDTCPYGPSSSSKCNGWVWLVLCRARGAPVPVASVWETVTATS